MVLVDTSVWIRSLGGREPYIGEVDSLLERDKVVTHDLVYGELLVGDPGGRKAALAIYGKLHRVPTVAHEEVVFLTLARKLHGRGLSWIDVHLLASALAGRHELYTADEALAGAAAELGVAYSPRSSR